MCTWFVVETVDYFLRNGSDVFTCQTDISKAFDMVRHSFLLRKLLDCGFSRIFLRIFIFIYSFQFANVRWNGAFSNIFRLCNGVRQGAILSGILYCFYVNEIFESLRRRKLGCWINSNFHGMAGYSDDNWILAPLHRWTPRDAQCNWKILHSSQSEIQHGSRPAEMQNEMCGFPQTPAPSSSRFSVWKSSPLGWSRSSFR